MNTQISLTILLLIIELIAFAWLILNKSKRKQNKIIELENQILNLENSILEQEENIIKEIKSLKDFLKPKNEKA